MSFQWRRFQFFDKDVYGDEEGKLALQVLNDFPHISCSTSGPRALVFASKSGMVRLVNRDMEVVTFPAHEGGGGVSHLCLLSRHSVLVTLGEEDQQATLKFWLIDRTDASGHPLCAKKLTVFSRAFPPSPITCIAVMEDLSQCALGCVNGQVLLLEGSLIKDRAPKVSYLMKDIGPTITSLLYREDEPAAATQGNPFPLPASPPSLFVCSSESLLSFYPKQAKAGRIELDATKGVEAGLAVLTSDELTRKLVVGRKEAVYTFEVEEQSEAFAFEGTKKLIGWHHHFLAIVTEGVKGTPTHHNITPSHLSTSHPSVTHLRCVSPSLCSVAVACLPVKHKGPLHQSLPDCFSSLALSPFHICGAPTHSTAIT